MRQSCAPSQFPSICLGFLIDHIVGRWESGHYHLGQFHDQCFKNLSRTDQENRYAVILQPSRSCSLCFRGTKMNLYTVRFFAKAIKFGSKYVYQTIPRLLTIWLDMGENLARSEQFPRINTLVAKAINETPVYKVGYSNYPRRYDWLMGPPVVHGLSSDCISRGPYQPGCLHQSIKTYFISHSGVSKSSPLAIRVCSEVHQT